MKHKIRFLLAGILLILAGETASAAVAPFPAMTASVPALRRKLISGRINYRLGDLAQANRLQLCLAGKKFSLQKPGVVFRMEHNSRKLVFNGVRLELNFAPQLVDGVPYLSAFDWNRSIRPLLYPSTLNRHPVRVITVDMGHGGGDPGALGTFSKEKTITLALGRRLAAELRARGYRVCLTRESDVQIPLTKVPVLQKSHRSDLFISLHVNAAKNRRISGIETFCLTPAGAQSSNSGHSAAVSHPANRFDINNLALAYRLQNSLLRATRATDHGVKHARFVVLRELNAPGVLVEVGFISNAADEKKLNDPAYQATLARGIADGIAAYQRSVKSP